MNNSSITDVTIKSYNKNKKVPATAAERDCIRLAASEVACELTPQRVPSRDELELYGLKVLETVGSGTEYLGFAMVAVNNGFWRSQYAAVPTERRLLLLPHCLRNQSVCRASIDSIGLHCADCGACDITNLKDRAEKLGYTVIVAEGASSVLLKVMEGEADAILGVACLESLEKSYNAIAELGVPQVAVPLLCDGCQDTEAENSIILELLSAYSEPPIFRTQTYLPLLRLASDLFEPDYLSTLLPPSHGKSAKYPMIATESIAIDWLRQGGKRLRPFVTLTAYAVAVHGTRALEADVDARHLVPFSVQRLALAIEALHKASLAHDDIEDDDAFRYGVGTLHRVHGIPPAINVGDYLIGLGYRLVAGESAEIGPQAISDIMAHLSEAHLDLCRGQGAELLWNRSGEKLRPLDALAIYSKKTAPAFEAALYAGLRAGDAPLDSDLLRRFSGYIGEGYQILNDLEDWDDSSNNKIVLGQDLLSGRPNLLRSFAEEAGADPLTPSRTPDALVEQARVLYTSCGAFDRAGQLLDKLRERALSLASEAKPEPISDLLGFLTRIILRRND